MAKPKITFPKVSTAKSRFVEYLEAHSRKTFYGEDVYQCPVASFIKSQIEDKTIGVNVNGDYITLEYYGPKKRKDDDGDLIVEAEKKVAMPNWANTFVSWFDSQETKLTGKDILAKKDCPV